MQLLVACLVLALGWPLDLPSAYAASDSLATNSQGSGLDLGYRDMYNLDFGGAHAELAGWIQAHPADPLGPASDAAAYLFGEFDRLSIIDVQLFADDSRFDSRSKLIPDPTVRRAFEDRADQATRLADAVLARKAKGANALYAKTLVCGMRSDYALMIENHDFQALSYSKQASELARQTLAVNPTLYDAHLAYGVENYMLTLEFAPLRWILSFTGAGIDRAEGIRLLQVTASERAYLAPFARMMLAVAAVHDGHPQLARNSHCTLRRVPPKQPFHPRARPYPLDSQEAKS